MSCLTLCSPMDWADYTYLTFTVSQSLLKLMSIESWSMDHHSTILSSVVPFSSFPQSFPVSGSFPVSQLFASRYQSFFISPSNDYSGLISFSIDWFDFLAVQGAIKSLLQHHSLKASVLWCTAFFMVHLSRLYLTTGKTLALNVWTFVERDVSVF